jgi:hypothetical protein
MRKKTLKSAAGSVPWTGQIFNRFGIFPRAVFFLDTGKDTGYILSIWVARELALRERFSLFGLRPYQFIFLAASELKNRKIT